MFSVFISTDLIFSIVIIDIQIHTWTKYEKQIYKFRSNFIAENSFRSWKKIRNSLAITSYSATLRVSSRDDFVICLKKYIRREMNSSRCAGLWWILCSRFWRKWWQTCLLWFFSTSDVKETTLTIQASTTWIKSLHTFLLQWNLHRFSSHVRKKSDRTNFPACISHPKFPVHRRE